MTPSDTPETNYAERAETSIVSSDFARSLERRMNEAIRDRDELAQWKHGQLTVESWWQRIDDFIRSHPDGVVGHSVADTALRFLRERDAALALIYAIEEIYTDGFDTVQDRKTMGEMAREFLETLKGKEAV